MPSGNGIGNRPADPRGPALQRTAGTVSRTSYRMFAGRGDSIVRKKQRPEIGPSGPGTTRVVYLEIPRHSIGGSGETLPRVALLYRSRHSTSSGGENCLQNLFESVGIFMGSGRNPQMPSRFREIRSMMFRSKRNCGDAGHGAGKELDRPQIAFRPAISRMTDTVSRRP